MDNLINKIKTSLAQLGTPDSELRRLYKQALMNSKAQLEKDTAVLEEKKIAVKNDLQSAAALAKKNAGIESEKRGLIGAGAVGVLEKASEQKMANELELLQETVDEQKQSLIEKQKVQEEKQYQDLIKAETKQKASLEKQLTDAEKTVTVTKPPKYNPKVTTKELAKSILERYPGDKEKANEFVAGLNQLYDFDDDYLRDLAFAIEAYSIKDTVSDSSGVNVATSKLKQLIAQGEEVFKDAHQKIYRTLAAKGESGLSLSKSAIEMAKLSQMDFFYRSSPTKAQFELICKQAGLTAKEIEEYGQRVDFINNHTDGRLELGELLKKEG